MQVVSWNVNGIRSRIGRIQGFLERTDADVLCLQETKVQDGGFPRLAFMDRHIEAYGQSSFNGVAILSKTEPDEVLRGFDNDPVQDQKRCIAARFGSTWIYNLYVVNGKSVDDPAFHVKKQWLAGLHDTVAARHQSDQQVLLVGDWNITPRDIDSCNPDGMREQIHHTSAERAWLGRFYDWGLTDLHVEAMARRGVRETRDSNETEFSWWDYRASAFGRGQGLRIDLALGTDAVARKTRDVWVDRDERKKGDLPEKPSDHAPLVVELQ